MATRRDTKAGRFYEIDGELYPSVTHVLSVIAKPALVAWAANTERALVVDAAADLYLDTQTIKAPMSRPAYISTLESRLGKTKAHQKELAKAADIGTQAHQAIEHHFHVALGHKVGPEPRLTDKSLWAFMAFEDWAREHHVKPVLIENTVWHTGLRYAGTLDLVAEVDGDLAVVDFKTGKGIYAEAHLQNAAYQTALASMGHQPISTGYIVRLPKRDDDPAFEVQRTPPAETLMPTFEAALRVWQWWHAEEQASKARWMAAKNQEAAS